MIRAIPRLELFLAHSLLTCAVAPRQASPSRNVTQGNAGDRECLPFVTLDSYDSARSVFRAYLLSGDIAQILPEFEDLAVFALDRVVQGRHCRGHPVRTIRFREYLLHGLLVGVRLEVRPMRTR